VQTEKRMAGLHLMQCNIMSLQDIAAQYILPFADAGSN
jgi:hypothetical protein